jgi:hypothetical protein
MSTRSCNLSIEKLSSGWTARLILHVRTMCSQLRKFYPRSDCTLGSGARTQHNIDLERFSSTKTFAHDKRMDCATDLTRTNHVESAVQVISKERLHTWLWSAHSTSHKFRVFHINKNITTRSLHMTSRWTWCATESFLGANDTKHMTPNRCSHTLLNERSAVTSSSKIATGILRHRCSKVKIPRWAKKERIIKTRN